MKKFEVGKIYSFKESSGCGYDECSFCNYYLITRKTEKSIWYKRISVAVELYGKLVNEKADFNKFEKAAEKRSKINPYEDWEGFMYTYKPGWQDYICLKHAKEVELN